MDPVFLTVLFLGGVILIAVIYISVSISIDKAKRDETESLKTHTPRNFKPDKMIGDALALDTAARKWAVPDEMPDGSFAVTAYTKIYDFSDILDYSLIENNKTITTGGVSIGKAVVGGVLFGGVGAVIGGTSGAKTSVTGCTARSIKITLNNLKQPCVYIVLYLNGKTIHKANSEEILSALDIITKAPDRNVQNTQSVNSTTDEIKKYKELLDIGAITQEEFDKKKAELLKL